MLDQPIEIAVSPYLLPLAVLWQWEYPAVLVAPSITHTSCYTLKGRGNFFGGWVCTACVFQSTQWLQNSSNIVHKLQTLTTCQGATQSRLDLHPKLMGIG
eukprot:jgi/Botrbrau1/12701/Bobra.67_1s0065.1